MIRGGVRVQLRRLLSSVNSRLLVPSSGVFLCSDYPGYMVVPFRGKFWFFASSSFRC